MNVTDRVPLRGARAEEVNQLIRDNLVEYEKYFTTYGRDLLEIRNWQWTDMEGKQPRPCTVRIIATNEDLVIARHTRALFFRKMFVSTKERKFGE